MLFGTVPAKSLLAKRQCFFWAQIWAVIFDGQKFGPRDKIWTGKKICAEADVPERV